MADRFSHNLVPSHPIPHGVRYESERSMMITHTGGHEKLRPNYPRGAASAVLQCTSTRSRYKANVAAQQIQEWWDDPPPELRASYWAMPALAHRSPGPTKMRNRKAVVSQDHVVLNRELR